MRVALIDSGLGMVPTASWLTRLAPELDLVLCLDPDGAPWGPRSRDSVIERVFIAVEAALRHDVDTVVLPCNTASVVALDAVRQRLEPDIPVIGTVPAIKPAAARHHRFAVWATATTTASAYQRGLIETFARRHDVTAVPCNGLAESIDRGDDTAIDAAIDAAAHRTPPGCPAIVLGCTHYPLVADQITARLPGVDLVDSAPAVARQTLRRILERTGVDPVGLPEGSGGTIDVVCSGRPGALPQAVARYPLGRPLLARLADPASSGRRFE